MVGITKILQLIIFNLPMAIVIMNIFAITLLLLLSCFLIILLIFVDAVIGIEKHGLLWNLPIQFTIAIAIYLCIVVTIYKIWLIVR